MHVTLANQSVWQRAKSRGESAPAAGVRRRAVEYVCVAMAVIRHSSTMSAGGQWPCSREPCASERAEAGRWLRAHRRAVVAYVITAAARSGTTGDPSLRGPKAAELFSSSGLERVR